MTRMASNSKLNPESATVSSSSSVSPAATATTRITTNHQRCPILTTSTIPTGNGNQQHVLPNGSNKLVSIGASLSSLSTPTSSSSSIRITKKQQPQRKIRCYKTTKSFLQVVCFLLVLLVLVLQYAVLHWNQSSSPTTNNNSLHQLTTTKNDLNTLSLFTNNNQHQYNNITRIQEKNNDYNQTNVNIKENVSNQQSQSKNSNNENNTKSANNNNNDNKSVSTNMSNRAILFWGLPRAFDTIVLPSIVENIIIPNQKYRCDYYIHYYDLSSEAAGRSGSGGTINTVAIHRLQNIIEQYHTNNVTSTDHNNYGTLYHKPIIQFVSNTETEFWDMYTPLIEKIRTTKDPNGRYYYYPWRAITYVHPTTTDNIIKMWHTIQAVWNLMESYRYNLTQSTSNSYKQVAMLRSDILYVTPIDIYEDPTKKESPATTTTTFNTSQGTAVAVIPNFGKHPVSDRIIYGPYDAVRIWATQRFNHLEEHVKFIYDNDRGWGLHHERFMNYTIYPLIRQRANVPVIHHPTMCFLRARSDESIWISDCQGPRTVSDPTIMQQWNGSIYNLRKHIERILGRKCSKITKPRVNVKSLMCSSKNPPM